YKIANHATDGTNVSNNFTTALAIKPNQPAGTPFTAVNVGINTANPTAPLEVAGNVKISGNGNALVFPDNTTMTTASVGITVGSSVSGNTSAAVLRASQAGSVAGGISASAIQTNTFPAGARGDSSTTQGFAAGVLGAAISPDAVGVLGVNTAAQNASS